MLPLANREAMTGSLKLGSGPARAISLTVYACPPTSLRLFLRSSQTAPIVIPIVGEIDAEGFADKRGIKGIIDASVLKNKKIVYAFSFCGNDDKDYTFAGNKELRRGVLLESLSLLVGSIRDDNDVEVGRVLLRFDLRSTFVRLLQRAFALQTIA